MHSVECILYPVFAWLIVQRWTQNILTGTSCSHYSHYVSMFDDESVLFENKHSYVWNETFSKENNNNNWN